MTAQRIAIVGGGPAGAALAILCARSGDEVVVYEEDPSPRPSVGESLLPYGHRMWKKLGLNLDDSIEKCGAVFYRNGRSERIDFTEARACPFKSAFQVDRRKLDPRLRELALAAGAEFREEQVKSAPQGFDWVIDASGRRRILGRKWTSFNQHPQLRNIAHGSHYEGAKLPAPCRPGDIAIVGEDGMWFWIIPLTETLMSVGVVLTSSTRHLNLNEAISRSQVMQGAVQSGTLQGKTRGFADFTESANQFAGPGWGLVGDAAFFLDPVFSSGVLFAFEGADRMHEVIRGRITAEEYQQQMLAASRMMESLVLGFYDGNFLELAFSPVAQQSQEIRSGLVGLLAGNLFDDATRAEKMVARRLSGLAELTLQRIPFEQHLRAPIFQTPGNQTT